MDKPNLIATPVLINILRGSKHDYDNEWVYLTYDTDKILLEVHYYDNEQLDVSMWIGGEKEITLREEQKEIIKAFLNEFYGEQRTKNSSEYIQDTKDDLKLHDRS